MDMKNKKIFLAIFEDMITAYFKKVQHFKIGTRNFTRTQETMLEEENCSRMLSISNLYE